tara:strand:- start:6395 stop:6847 length:453 start_codon:yes stop_codon:yes gene_type:complete
MRKPKNTLNQIGQWFELTNTTNNHRVGERLMCAGIAEDDKEFLAYFEKSFMIGGNVLIRWSDVRKVMLADEGMDADKEMKIYIREIGDQRDMDEIDYDWSNILSKETIEKHFPKPKKPPPSRTSARKASTKKPIKKASTSKKKRTKKKAS